MNHQSGIHPLIMIVEDHRQIVDIVEFHLRPHYELIVAESCGEALDLLQTHRPVLIVLDIGLSDGREAGYTLLKMIRKGGELASLGHLASIPIIALTARGKPVEALNLGADDYIAKPFDGHELLARIQARLRKHNIINCGPISLSYDQREARIDGEAISLSWKEFEILYLLTSEPERVFSYQEIYERVWKQRYFKSSDVTIRIQVMKLRDALGELCKPMIVAVWGEGYKFSELARER